MFIVYNKFSFQIYIEHYLMLRCFSIMFWANFFFQNPLTKSKLNILLASPMESQGKFQLNGSPLRVEASSSVLGLSQVLFAGNSLRTVSRQTKASSGAQAMNSF